MSELTLDQFFTESANKQRLLQCFWTIALVRYLPFNTGKSVKKPWVQHIFTRPRLSQLSEMGYIDVIEKDVYTITLKGLKYLSNNDHNTKYIKPRTRGHGGAHSLKLTEAILAVMDEPYFFTVFYPTFTKPPEYTDRFLEPDACIVYKKEDAYRLVFLEIETDKPDWENYLLEKKHKYDTVGKSYETYSVWWRKFSQQLDLAYPASPSDFCFSVLCIPNKQLNYNWSGWRFETRNL